MASEALTQLTPFIVLAGVLVMGLLVYERTGLRLGGILVLPLLLFYTLADWRLLVCFAGGAVAATWIGMYIQSRTFLYGRRLMIIYLAAGLLSCGSLIVILLPGYPGVALTVLPGIFAYNVHREGRPVRSLTVFSGMFVAGYFIVVAAHAAHSLPNFGPTGPAAIFMPFALVDVPRATDLVLGLLAMLMQTLNDLLGGGSE